MFIKEQKSLTNYSVSNFIRMWGFSEGPNMNCLGIFKHCFLEFNVAKKFSPSPQYCDPVGFVTLDWT